MVCMLAEKLAAVCVDTTDPGIVKWLESKGIEIIPVSYQDTMDLGCNVMALGNDKVISPAQSVDLNARLRARGFEVYDPDVSMFTMGGGGIHCMAMPLRRDPV
jgi:N-dimethylarginine dimethylaminohydrolase